MRRPRREGGREGEREGEKNIGRMRNIKREKELHMYQGNSLIHTCNYYF